VSKKLIGSKGDGRIAAYSGIITCGNVKLRNFLMKSLD